MTGQVVIWPPNPRAGVFGSWSEWREKAVERVESVVRGCFCPVCWGNRRILEPSELGGLVPVVCEACGGRGWV